MIEKQWQKQQKSALKQAIKYAGSVAALSKLLGCPTSAIVHGWIKRGRISIKYANELHYLTKGKINRADLRPDIQDWARYED